MRFKRPLILAALVFFPLLVGAAAPQLVETIRTLAVNVARPLLDAQEQISHFVRTQLVEPAIEWPKLRTENERLRLELEDLKAKLIGFDELENRLGRLEALLDLKEGVHGKGVAARIIGRDPSPWSQFILINKGSADGVYKNSVLVHPDGLVGKVLASGTHSARAILLPDSESRVSAMNQRTRDMGLVEGRGSSFLKMTYLDRRADVKVGDLILSSGLGGIYPKGVPIGEVELVGQEKDRLGLFAIVRPFVSFAKLEEVLCVSSQAKG